MFPSVNGVQGASFCGPQGSATNEQQLGPMEHYIIPQYSKLTE